MRLVTKQMNVAYTKKVTDGRKAGKAGGMCHFGIGPGISGQFADCGGFKYSKPLQSSAFFILFQVLNFIFFFLNCPDK